MVRDIVAPGLAHHVRRVEAGRHAAQAARREPAARPRLAAPHRSSPTGIASTYEWFCATHSAEPAAQPPPLAARRSSRRDPPVRPSHGVVTVADATPANRSSADGYRASRVAHWDGVARRSAAGAVTWLAATTAALERVYRFLVPPGSRVLELGCGEGDLLAALAPARGVGVDFSPAMIAAARGARHPQPALRRRRRPRPLGARHGPFDVIVLSDLLNDAWDVQALLSGLQRLCHPRHARGHQLLQPAVGGAARRPRRGWAWRGRCSSRTGSRSPTSPTCCTSATSDVIRTWQEVLLPLPLPRAGAALQPLPGAAVGLPPPGADELHRRAPARRCEPPAPSRACRSSCRRATRRATSRRSSRARRRWAAAPS